MFRISTFRSQGIRFWVEALRIYAAVTGYGAGHPGMAVECF